MKKLMIAATVAFCATVSFAELASANIVGYTTITLTEKNSIVGINFTGVDGNAMSINEAVPYAEGMVKGNAAANADQIQVQDGNGGYKTYYMSNGLNAKGQVVAGLEGKWANGGSTTVATDVIPAGKGAWFCRKGSESITLTIASPIAE